MKFYSGIFTSVMMAVVLSGCSGKQINETTDSIVHDMKSVSDKATEQH